jgi:SAM-dependent methyltransferase
MNTPKPDNLAEGKPADAGDFILERRHRLVRSLLPNAGGSLLDFGCGNGAQTAFFANQFDSITGLDVNARSITEFSARFLDLEISARGLAYEGRDIPLETATIDCAISFEVLEHVDDERHALRELHRVLRPGGLLAMSVPNRWWIFETHGAELPLLPWHRVPFFSWLPKSIHDRYARARIYRRREIVGKLREQDFELLHSSYITAPMDAVTIAPLRDLLRATLFRDDETPLPFMATAVLVIARKPA